MTWPAPLGGRFLLRMEDIDRARCKPAWERQIYDDLHWLGLRWDGPVMRQSERLPAYRTALDDLWSRDLLYVCDCTRRDIAEALSAPQEGTLIGPDGPVYPGTCRGKTRAGLPFSLRSTGPRPHDAALRLLMPAAAALVCDHDVVTRRTIGFKETGHGPRGEHGWIETSAAELTEQIGDIVLARRDIGTSYHLAVVVDDAAQGITRVVRGEDLFEASRIHVVLQKLLELQTPTYFHHRLIRDTAGKRLAKRDDARAIARYRAEGASPDDIRRMVGL